MKNRCIVVFFISGLILGAAVGCQSQITREYEENTTRTVSQEPVVGGAPSH